jgi:iron-sulfur cluster repair protein YtfE (RIC family)
MTGLEEFITDLEEHMRLENEVFLSQFEPGGVTHV